MTSTMNWPPLPSWQIDSLNNLAAQNKLSGVPPQVIAVIDQAESGGSGGGINSSGYGGFFGLGVDQPYPGGTPNQTLLRGTDPDSFAGQAQIAASAFAGYLTQANGNPVLAEQIYQTGDPGGPPGEGAQLMSQYTGGGNVPLTPIAAAVQQAESGARKPVKCTPVIRIAGQTFLNSCQTEEWLGGAIMVAGGLLLFAGITVVMASLGGRKIATYVIGDIMRQRMTKQQAARAQIRTGEREATAQRRLRHQEATRKGRMREREQRTGLKIQEREQTASARRYGSGAGRGPTPAQRKIWQEEGFEAG